MELTTPLTPRGRTPQWRDWLVHPRTADVAPVLALMALGLIPDPDGRSSILAAVLIPLPLLARRRWPVVVFVVVMVLAVARLLAEANSINEAGVVLALYTIAATRPAAQAVVAALLTEAGMVAAVLRYADEDWLGPLIGVSGLVVAATALGISVQGRRALVASLQERAARLEVERDQERQLATAAERARIAREMHDIVAHSLTVMVSLADGAVNVAPHSPQRAERAMQDVAETGRSALVEMRRLLGVLRDDRPGGLEPQPGLAQIPELVEHVREAGTSVAIERLDMPGFSASPGLQLAVFRIVQESLTNVLKHAGAGAGAALAIRWDGRRVTVEITSTGEAEFVQGVGGGLAGMRERAAAFNGAVEAGPDGRGGWAVRAVLSDEPTRLGP